MTFLELNSYNSLNNWLKIVGQFLYLKDEMFVFLESSYNVW